MRLNPPAPAHLVPGIERHPDLASAMLTELRVSDCCSDNRITEKYREKLARRLERDKLTRRR